MFVVFIKPVLYNTDILFLAEADSLPKTNKIVLTASLKFTLGKLIIMFSLLTSLILKRLLSFVCNDDISLKYTNFIFEILKYSL
ncbi:hypothetical protein A0H76_684 [Hepatospora eriocheir]|uniref:Uncharacterized protein n=1 Tax=Hepatospora eriocheir TaxID=1081669 RepID=A0A1X0QIH0_9MICR|nr:hypothetical protein A0H76_684 [Hepatospora eriocheir]